MDVLVYEKMGWVGEGTQAGLRRRIVRVPRIPETVESVSPAELRSSRYQRKGLTSARVAESWRGEDHGVLRIAKAMPMKAPMLLTTSFHSTALSPLDRVGEAGFRLLGAECSSSTHVASIHGNRLPIATLAAPQKARYRQLSRFKPSIFTGATFRSSCRCATSAPYASPKLNNTTTLDVALNVRLEFDSGA